MMRPIGARVMVKRDEPEDMTQSGILIPKSAQNSELIVFGIVKAISPSIDEVKVGDHVAYSDVNADTVRVGGMGGEDYDLVPIDSIVATLEK